MSIVSSTTEPIQRRIDSVVKLTFNIAVAFAVAVAVAITVTLAVVVSVVGFG